MDFSLQRSFNYFFNKTDDRFLRAKSSSWLKRLTLSIVLIQPNQVLSSPKSLTLSQTISPYALSFFFAYSLEFQLVASLSIIIREFLFRKAPQFRNSACTLSSSSDRSFPLKFCNQGLLHTWGAKISLLSGQVKYLQI